MPHAQTQTCLPRYRVSLSLIYLHFPKHLPSLSLYIQHAFFRDGRPFAKMLIRYPVDVLRTWNACASRFALWSEKMGINNGRWREQIAIVAIQHDFAVPLFCFRLICFQVPQWKGFALTSWHHVFMNRLWKMRYSQVPPSPSSPPYANVQRSESRRGGFLRDMRRRLGPKLNGQRGLSILPRRHRRRSWA